MVKLQALPVWDHAFQAHTGKKRGLYVVTNEVNRKLGLYKLGKTESFNSRFNTYRQCAGAENTVMVLAVIEMPVLDPPKKQLSLTEAESLARDEFEKFVEFQKNTDTKKVTEWFKPNFRKTETDILWGLDNAKNALWNAGCQACVVRQGNLRADRLRGAKKRPDIQITGSTRNGQVLVSVGGATAKPMSRNNPLLKDSKALRDFNAKQSRELEDMLKARG